MIGTRLAATAAGEMTSMSRGTRQRSVRRTFGSVFPSMEIWDSGAGDVILVGSNQPWDSSVEHLRVAYGREQVRQDLAAIGIDSPEAFLARQFASQRTAFAIPGPGPIQSDNFPVLEYEAPLAFFIGATASGVIRFDERTWQLALAAPEKRAVLGQLATDPCRRSLNIPPSTRNCGRRFRAASPGRGFPPRAPTHSCHAFSGLVAPLKRSNFPRTPARS